MIWNIEYNKQIVDTTSLKEIKTLKCVYLYIIKLQLGQIKLKHIDKVLLRIFISKFVHCLFIIHKYIINLSSNVN